MLLQIAHNRIKRDIRRVAEVLIADGRAVWLGEPFYRRDLPALDEMPRTLERIRQLLDEPDTAHTARDAEIEVSGP